MCREGRDGSGRESRCVGEGGRNDGSSVIERVDDVAGDVNVNSGIINMSGGEDKFILDEVGVEGVSRAVLETNLLLNSAWRNNEGGDTRSVVGPEINMAWRRKSGDADKTFTDGILGGLFVSTNQANGARKLGRVGLVVGEKMFHGNGGGL